MSETVRRTGGLLLEIGKSPEGAEKAYTATIALVADDEKLKEWIREFDTEEEALEESYKLIESMREEIQEKIPSAVWMTPKNLITGLDHSTIKH